jgi:O-antigen/teichoic acid export membrane protein
VSGPPDTARLAAQVAGGSGLVLLGGIFDRGLRWALKWALAALVGPGPVGLVELATRWSSTITAFSPMGLDTGVAYFLGRHRAAGDRGAVKGLVLASMGASTGVGALCGAGLAFAGARGWVGGADPALGAILIAAGPLVAVSTPLLTLIGLLRAAGDARRSTLASQVAQPLALLLLALPVAALGGGPVGVLHAMSAAAALALALAGRAAWGHFGALFGAQGPPPTLAWGPLLGFSVPQSLTAAAFRLNQYFDVLILGAYASAEEVGVYAVASSIAGFGAVPSNALISMFNPIAAGLIARGERAALNRLLQAASRWLIVVSLPLFLLLLLLPDLLIALYPRAFAGAAPLLLVLSFGQLIQTACAPAMRLIPMSGRAGLNLANGVAALLLNLGLSLWWVPTHGGAGAAWAGALTLAAWSIWRLAEVWWLLRCWPFDGRTLIVLGLAGAGGLGLQLGLPVDALGLRVGGALGLLLALGALVRWQPRTPEDEAVLGGLVGKLRARLGRRGGA